MRQHINGLIARARGFYYRHLCRSTGPIQVRRGPFVWRLFRDPFVDRSILYEGVFEAPTTRAFQELIEPGMHILDVGANFGYFTVLFANSVGPNGRVWAFEPVEQYFKRLSEHIEINGLADRVVACHVGLSDKEEDLNIRVQESSATLYPVTDSGREETIHLRRLDDVYQEIGIVRADMMKVDIDGHELHFLRGAEEFIKTYTPVIVMEFTPRLLNRAGTDEIALKDYVESLGYVLHSEETGKVFGSQEDFMRQFENPCASVNIWAFPKA